MPRLVCNTPDGTKHAGADAGACHQPPRGRTTASGALSPTSRRLRSIIDLWRLLALAKPGLSDGAATLS
jgi:hypothetical protein